MFKKIFKMLGAQEEAPKPGIHFATFGKHPGWDDHMDELGLDTEGLVQLRRVLYTEGVNPNVDSGAWTNLDPRHRLEYFDHFFVWRVSGEIIIGRLWSSSDGRGRHLYPMIVAAHCHGLTLEWCLHAVTPVVDEAKTLFTATRSADDVRRGFDGLRSRLLDLGARAPAQWEPADLFERAVARLAASPSFATDRTGFDRIMYQAERDLAPFRTGAETRPQTMRVPACEHTASDAAASWLGFLAGYIGPSTPCMVLVAPELAWVDLLVGPIGASQMFVMRASQERIPLVSQIPYSLDEAFTARAADLVARSIRGHSRVGTGA